MTECTIGESDNGTDSDLGCFQFAPIGLIEVDSGNLVRRANKLAGEVLGVDPAALVNGHFGAEPAGDSRIAAAAQGQLSRLAAVCQPGQESIFCRQDGRRVRAYKVGTGGGTGARLVSLTDVSEEWAQCRRLTRTRARIGRTDRELQAYRTALERVAIVGATDRQGRLTYVNGAFCEVSQYGSEDLLGRTHAVLNSGHHPRSFFHELWRTIGRGGVWHGEICNRAKNGALYWVDTTITPVPGADGRINGYLSVCFEITERKRAEQQAQEEMLRRSTAESLLRDVIEAIPAAVAAYDSDDRLTIYNSAYRTFYEELADHVVVGVPFEALLRRAVANGLYALPDDSTDTAESFVARRLDEHRNPSRGAIQQMHDGRWFQVQERKSSAGYIVGVRTDISALKGTERRMRYQADHDALTGLLNRSVLNDEIERALRRHVPSGRTGALVVLDLDNFKEVNDTMGHGTGDALLVTVAQRLDDILRTSDRVFRMGGDEFAVILHNVRDEASVERLLDRMRAAIAAPMEIEGRTVRAGTSMGVCMFPRDSDRAGEMLKFADIALYQAKASGRNHHVFFSDRLRQSTEQRGAIADALRSALAGDGIDVALQPQFDLASLRHSGFEALARWSHPGRHLAPQDFIPVAEASGLIVPLGRHVLERTLVAMRSMLDQGLDPGVVAVNVAADQLKDEGFVDDVVDMLGRHGLPPTMLEVEVTETVLLDRSATRIARALDRLHQLGIHIALDDFGTGHASLTHLKQFPVDRLKIDRSFVNGIGQGNGDEAIVCTIVGLAHSLGKSVVAEGIETAVQRDFLTELGCDIGQGYLVSRPLSVADAILFLRERVAQAA